MEIKTNLRALRHRYRLPLAELEAASGLSNQYLSRAELGQLSATERLEKQLDACSERRHIQMSNETYYIPTNFTDAGRVMGLFEIRNLIEAVLLTLPMLYLCLAFVPLALTPKIIVTLTVLVPVGGFGLIGVNDDSLTRWLGSWWRWRKGRRLITFRGECKKK